MSDTEAEPSTKFDPDEDATADRQPAACPFCGHDGVFDGQGDWPDEIETARAGVRKEYDVTWVQHRCPECNGTFQMLTEAEQVRVEVNA